MNGISAKELQLVSFLELNGKFFFQREDVAKFFKSRSAMNFVFHKLLKKRRIVKLNKDKYCLIPVRAFEGHWSDHPFIIADELFNGSNYCIAGLAAAYYWGQIEQIPTKMEVWCTKKQGVRMILGVNFIFKRRRMLENVITRRIKNHMFRVLNKGSVAEWLKLR